MEKAQIQMLTYDIPTLRDFDSAESALLFPGPTRGSGKRHPSPVPTLPCSALNTASVYHATKHLYTCACRKSESGGVERVIAGTQLWQIRYATFPPFLPI